MAVPNGPGRFHADPLPHRSRPATAATTAGTDDCELCTEGNDEIAFDKGGFALPSGCSEVKRKLAHNGSRHAEPLGPDRILVEASNFATPSTAAASFSAADAYLPGNDLRVIASTTMRGGGAITPVTTPLAEPGSGDHRHFCAFPGQRAVLQDRQTLR